MVAFRWLVAVLVTVVTLFGGAFRATDVARAQLALERANDDAKQATLDAGRPIVQGRATRPADGDGSDVVGPSMAVAARFPIARRDVRAVTVRPPTTTVPPRRVRAHVEHMVFLL